MIYTVSFVYENNKVVHEIWRDANTHEIVDDIFLTYNRRGDLIRNESFIGNAYVTYTYTPNGSLESWYLVFQGVPIARNEYTYDVNYKNPFKSLTGIEYSFWYSNSAFGVGTGNNWYSSEKVTLFDLNGDPYTYYEQDRAQTTWQIGQQHYPLQADYVDKSSQAPIINTFTYENCIPGVSEKAVCVNQSMAPENTTIKKVTPYFILNPKNTIEKLRAGKLR